MRSGPSSYLDDAHCYQEFDGRTTRRICHDYFKRTRCYCVEPTVLPQRKFEFAEIRVKEYYNAGLDQLFVKNYTCFEQNDPKKILESYCLDRYDGELECLDYSARKANGDGTASFNRLCYNRDPVEVNGQGSHYHESGYDASFTFNSQVRELRHDNAYLELDMDLLQDICRPICSEHGFIIANATMPQRSYTQTFTKFDSIETCDGCSIRKGGWV
ncbi:MAG: hypothetical protein Q9209_006100 [Squamulea sp. 1 TL-2023]